MRTLFIILTCMITFISSAQTHYDISLTEPGTVLNHVDFNNLEQIESLKISGTISKIDIEAIKKLNNLKKLDIENTLLKYDQRTIDQAIEKIKTEVLMIVDLAISMGKEITPSEEQELKKSLEQEIKKTKELYLKGAVIESGLFQDFFAIEEILLPQNIQIMEDDVFKNCFKLKNISLPEKIISIGWNTFENCRNLKSMIFPSTLAKLGAETFKYCDSLESVTFTSNLEEIGRNCFMDCINLKEISIKNVNTINTSFICDCNKLKTIKCFATTPPELGYYDMCVLEVNKDVNFFVPKESITAYFGSVWADYFTIKVE